MKSQAKIFLDFAKIIFADWLNTFSAQIFTDFAEIIFADPLNIFAGSGVEPARRQNLQLQIPKLHI